MTEPNPIDAAVEITRTLLQGDGYDVAFDGFSEGELRLTVIAGPDACADCLVPKPMLATLISANLPPELDGTRIMLTYPPDSIHA